jgi:hypothetical protein
MKNHSELIKSVQSRTLTAKGNKFVWKCIDLVAELNGLKKYAPELKETKEKIRTVLYDLIIDKQMTIDQITELIRSRKGIEI